MNQYASPRRAQMYLPPAREARRLVSMLIMLILLGFMIAHTRKPETWAWLVENHAQASADDGIPPAKPDDSTIAIQEELIPNPTDEDAGEWEQAQEQFRNVRDKVPMQFEEMPLYWRFFKWSRAQTMASMEARAQKNPFFTQFWDRPDTMRGKLVTLRLHVRRVLSHEAPENSAGVKRVYELWGVTDESRGHPYVVITDQLPSNLKEGAEVFGEAVFCGYFLKLLGYEASDARRGSPLLVGKVRGLPNPPSLIRDPEVGRNHFWQSVLTGAIVILLLIGARMLYRPKKNPTTERLTQELDHDAMQWLGNENSPPTPTGPGHRSESKSEPPVKFDFLDDPDSGKPPQKP